MHVSYMLMQKTDGEFDPPGVVVIGVKCDLFFLLWECKLVRRRFIQYLICIPSLRLFVCFVYVPRPPSSAYKMSDVICPLSEFNPSLSHYRHSRVRVGIVSLLTQNLEKLRKRHVQHKIINQFGRRLCNSPPHQHKKVKVYMKWYFFWFVCRC